MKKGFLPVLLLVYFNVVSIIGMTETYLLPPKGQAYKNPKEFSEAFQMAKKKHEIVKTARRELKKILQELESLNQNIKIAQKASPEESRQYTNLLLQKEDLERRIADPEEFLREQEMLLKKSKEKKPPVLKKPKNIREEIAKEEALKKAADIEKLQRMAQENERKRREVAQKLQEFEQRKAEKQATKEQETLLKDNLEELHKNLMQLQSRL